MGIGARDYAAAGRPDTRGARSLGGPARLAPIDTSQSGISAGYRGPLRQHVNIARTSRIDRRPIAGETLDYAHKLGQNVLLWGGLAVFGFVMLRSHDRQRWLRGLMHQQVAR